MKRILSITLISTVTLMLSSGCSGGLYSPEHKDAKVSKNALYVKTHNNEKIIHAIKKAGEETGWKITEFKSNEVIAEKIDDGKTVSSSIKFTGGHIEFENADATSDLRDAIEDELSKDSSSH